MPEPTTEVIGNWAETERAQSRQAATSSLTSRIVLIPNTDRPMPNREDLVNQGLTRQQANHVLVRRYQEQQMVAIFRCYFTVYALLILFVAILSCAFFLWVFVEYLKYSDDGFAPCDVPLKTWCSVLFYLMAFQAVKDCLCRIIWFRICRWNPEEGQPMPLRVKLLNLLPVFFSFTWNCLGVYWSTVSVSNTALPRCGDVSPSLLKAVRFYSSVSVFLTGLLFLNIVGLTVVLRVLAQLGVIRSRYAAPKGTLERCMECVSPATIDSDNKTCSICLEELDERTAVLRTKGCKHYFHKSCIQGWLNVNSNCPLCRFDFIVDAQTDIDAELVVSP